MIRCSDCPVLKLEKDRSTTEAGRMLEIALDLDYASTTFKIGWDEVPALDATAVRILKLERDNYHKELMERKT